MPRIIKMWLFSTLLSFTAIGMWKGIEWYYTRDSEAETPIIISAEDIARSYESNEDYSDSLYQGNTVIMTGVVSNMGSAGTYFTVNLIGNIYHIDLSFYDPFEIAKLGNISNGEVITIRGTVIGLNLVYVSITNCSIE